MLVSNGSLDQEGSVASENAPEKKEKAEKADLSFKDMAAKNVTRARRTIPEDEGDKAMSEHMMQSAIVFAILELADAVRSNEKL
jgi:hypothetical protein